MIVSIDDATAREKFLRAPFGLNHGLSGHPLFTLERLVQLAQEMPRDRIEYNSGKVLPGQRPEDIPMIDMPPDEVIRRIEDANAWMAIKGVEADPEIFLRLRQHNRGPWSSRQTAGNRDS